MNDKTSSILIQINRTSKV